MKWPLRVVDMLGREPRVGDWYAECCIQDFMQIKSTDDLLEILELYDDMDSGGRFWAMEEPARTQLIAEAKAEDGQTPLDRAVHFTF